MKITGIKVHIVEADAPERMFDLVTMDGQHRERWMHSAQPRPGQRPPSSGSGNTDRKSHELIMRVQTDEGIEGICTALLDSA